MIETVLNIIKMLIAILPFVIFCLLNTKTNLQKNERSRQFAMPVIALVFVIACMLIVDPISGWLVGIIQKIPTWIAALAAFSWMPDFLRSAILWISDMIANIIRSLNLYFWIFFIINTLIIILYLIIKKACIGIIRKSVKPDGALHTKVASVFYRYFFERNFWCLKDSYSQVRNFLKTFYYSAVVISSILMIVCAEMYKNEMLVAMFYPVFGIIIMGEMYFYLDGMTKGEYGVIMGEDDEAYKMVNYSLLRKVLRNLFGDKLLSENTGLNSSLAYGLTTTDILTELEKDEDPKITSFATYMNALHKTGFAIDHNYLQSSLDLLKGNSILFNNPFYKDLIPYAFYPMNRVLLSHKKVLVVLGRHAIEEDIKEWIEEGIGAVTNIPFLWNTAVLDTTTPEVTPDIGIVTRSEILNVKMHDANAEFLEEVGFVVIIEPSKLITTAQIGLNMLIKRCLTEDDKNIVYCMCDKNCDGLVDAMSHILMTEFTEVSATNKHMGTSSYMCWDADKDYLHHRLVPNISRYLGFGTELSFAALKNQVSKTEWYGGDVFPVSDIRWIDRQYYYDLTRYAGLPTNQESLNEYFRTSSNFWSAGIEKNNYFTVEDESFNMFEILRNFSTRTLEQGFINVISKEYLLKDYMADNASIFETDAKAIPYIVADHARTHRNTVLRLLLMMSSSPVCESVIEKELSLLGISVYDLPRQFWFEVYKCYASTADIQSVLSDDYKESVANAYTKSITYNKLTFDNTLIVIEDTFSLKSGRMEISYALKNEQFIRECISELRSASYVAEDEKGQRYYLGAELAGHIYQKYLPGQFFTFGGKYYEMQYLTADGQILVRRAADHINGRPSYRQERTYTIKGIRSSDSIGAVRDISGMKIMREYADYTVTTEGFYDMERYSDFENAKRIKFEGRGIPAREYRNKEILRIDLPDTDGRLTPEIRYTVAMLFNEIFRTLFAENHAYIAALTNDDFIGADDKHPITYTLATEGCELDPSSIYIVEDSQLDLGLTVAVERHLQRIMEIMYDYLDWHGTALANSLVSPTEPPSNVTFAPGTATGPKKRSPIGKLIDRVKGLFGRKPKDGETPTAETPTGETPTAETPTADGKDTKKKKKGGIFAKIGNLFKKKKKETDTDETPVDETPVDETPVDETPVDEAPVDETPVDETPKFSENAPADDTNIATESDTPRSAGLIPERKPYHERYYLLFGGVDEPRCIDASGAKDFLGGMGLDFNFLGRARDGKGIAAAIDASYDPNRRDVRYCDFCGTEIFGIEYETLADGRDRCMQCSKTAIKTAEEFAKIFEDVRRNMEAFFGIRLNVGVRVETVNSRTLHKRLGESFVPTEKNDGRVLGVAIHHRDGSFSLLVENGSPRMASVMTMAHELTHIWQYTNWNSKHIRKKYGKYLELEVYEGMAKWVEVQYAYLINEPALAKRTEIMTAYRDDAYGRGFLRYRANYRFSTGTFITGLTPFMFPEEPLAPDFCGEITIIPPKDDGMGLPDPDDDPTGGTGGGYTPTLPTTDTVLAGPVERNPDDPPLYARSLLSEEQKAVYDLFLDALLNFTPEIPSIPMDMTTDDVFKMFEQVLVDHPEIFWFRGNETSYFNTETGIVNKITLEFRYTKEEAEKAKDEILATIQPFLDSISDDMSDFEVALKVYETLVNLVDYDTVALDKQQKIAPEVRHHKPDPIRTIYGVFVDKKAVCAGYARAMQFLLKAVGIESAFISSGAHAWNLIKLEGDYYHLDVTWADSSNTKESDNVGRMIDYSFFCVTTSEMTSLDAHQPTDVLPLPECTATKCNYHHRMGLYFDSYDEERMRRAVCDIVSRGGRDISFKFSSLALRDKAVAELLDGGKMREMLRFAALETGVRISAKFRCFAPSARPVVNFFLEDI